MMQRGFHFYYVHPYMETHDSLKIFAPKAIRLLLFLWEKGNYFIGQYIK